MVLIYGPIAQIVITSYSIHYTKLYDRWPGGCYVSSYFWKDGIGAQKDRVAYPMELWQDVDVNSYGTDEFMTMCEMTGAEPLISYNFV